MIFKKNRYKDYDYIIDINRSHFGNHDIFYDVWPKRDGAKNTFCPSIMCDTLFVWKIKVKLRKLLPNANQLQDSINLGYRTNK